ncbi:MAG: hypothetical protein K8R87_12460 [Verrucomicrobia bacterium]|nr:hypothetical protein [Verrucomicrobiota bacterium]
MRIILTLLIIAGLIAGYFKFETWRQERTEKYWAGECRKWMEPLTREREKPVPLVPDEAAFFKLIYFLQKAKIAGVDLPKMIAAACVQLELPEEAGQVISKNVEESYEKAQKLQLLDDMVNMINLERGEAALIKSPGWLDEKVAVGQVVPVALAPEAACHLANLQLMPAVVRDAQGNTVTESIVARATALESMHVITRESLDRVKAAGLPKK